MVNPVERLCEAEPLVIANGASLSAGLNLGGRILTGVFMPSAWTAASLTFQASYDNVTFVDMYSLDGAELSVVAGASLYLPINYQNFMGVNFIKIRSGASAAAVNQGAARTLQLMLGAPAVQ